MGRHRTVAGSAAGELALSLHIGGTRFLRGSSDQFFVFARDYHLGTSFIDTILGAGCRPCYETHCSRVYSLCSLARYTLDQKAEEPCTRST
jgi:hypothetical protein